tara:strand:+ start:5860 stop:6549 length:690 start_codon:yes stop_codon:yes gene_type:complete
MKHIKLFEAFVNEAKGELTLTSRQTKKIAEWKDSADRIWYGETYKWLWKNASKFMKAKSVDDILKLNVGSFKPELVIQGAYIRQYGDTPTTYDGLVKILKGVDTSKMGYSKQGKEFDVYLGEYPGRNTSQDCGTVYATLAYDGKKDKLSIVNFGIRSGYLCDLPIKTPSENKDELPGFDMMDGNKLKSLDTVERDNNNVWYWGISKQQSWEEIETRLIDFFTDPDSNWK